MNCIVAGLHGLQNEIPAAPTRLLAIPFLLSSQRKSSETYDSMVPM